MDMMQLLTAISGQKPEEKAMTAYQHANLELGKERLQNEKSKDPMRRANMIINASKWGMPNLPGLTPEEQQIIQNRMTQGNKGENPYASFGISKRP
jgi:hypothetical protein